MAQNSRLGVCQSSTPSPRASSIRTSCCAGPLRRRRRDPPSFSFPSEADPAGADLLRRGGAPDSPDLERLLSACPGGPRTLDRIRALVRKGSPDPGPVGDLTLDGQALQARLSRHDGPESPASCWRLTLVPTAQGPGSLDQMLGLAVSGLPFA